MVDYIVMIQQSVDWEPDIYRVDMTRPERDGVRDDLSALLDEEAIHNYEILLPAGRASVQGLQEIMRDIRNQGRTGRKEWSP